MSFQVTVRNTKYGKAEDGDFLRNSKRDPREKKNYCYGNTETKGSSGLIKI